MGPGFSGHMFRDFCYYHLFSIDFPNVIFYTHYPFIYFIFIMVQEDLPYLLLFIYYIFDIIKEFASLIFFVIIDFMCLDINFHHIILFTLSKCIKPLMKTFQFLITFFSNISKEFYTSPVSTIVAGTVLKLGVYSLPEFFSEPSNSFPVSTSSDLTILLNRMKKVSKKLPWLLVIL